MKIILFNFIISVNVIISQINGQTRLSDQKTALSNFSELLI